MSLHAPQLSLADVVDDLGSKPVLGSQIVWRGRIFAMRADQVDLGEGGVVTREFVEHPGAVIIVALRGEPGAEQVVIIQQYRHPVASTEWELPAGLLDVRGEAPYLAAQRELAEEVDLVAARWDVLLDYFPSAGGFGEAIRIFLARDLTEVPADQRHEREAEEIGMPTGWLDLDDALEAALTGRFNNAGILLGIMAAHASRAQDWRTLRPYDAPWPQHPLNRG